MCLLLGTQHRRPTRLLLSGASTLGQLTPNPPYLLLILHGMKLDMRCSVS